MTVTASVIMYFKLFSWLSASKNTRKYQFLSAGWAEHFRWMWPAKHFRWHSFPDRDDESLTHGEPYSSFTCTSIAVLISVLLLLCVNSVHERRIRLSMSNNPQAHFTFLFAILLMNELLHGSLRVIDFWIKMMIWLCCCICMFLHLLNLNENSAHPLKNK